MRSEPGIDRFFQALTTALLLFGSALPGGLWLATPERSESDTEQRSLETTPARPDDLEALRAWPDAFESALADQVGLRDALIRLYGIVHVSIGASPVHWVLVGRDGWLFYRAETTSGLIDERLFSEDELQRWHDDYRARREILEPAGIPYLLVIQPEKSTLYREFLPDHARGYATTRTDQVVDRAKELGAFSLLDLRPAMRTAKDARRLYFKTDTHWNVYGANIAQFHITAALEEHLPQLDATLYPDASFHEVRRARTPGDLTNMLSLGGWLGERDVPELRSQNDLCGPDAEGLRFSRSGNCATERAGCTRRPVPNPFDLGERFGIADISAFEVRCDDAPVDATILVFRDSFFSELQPLFSGYFTRTVYIWSAATPKRLRYFTERVKPSVVIEARVEHYVLRLPDQTSSETRR